MPGTKQVSVLGHVAMTEGERVMSLYVHIASVAFVIVLSVDSRDRVFI